MTCGLWDCIRVVLGERGKRGRAVSRIIIGCRTVTYVWVRTAKNTMTWAERIILLVGDMVAGERRSSSRQVVAVSCQRECRIKSRHGLPPFPSKKRSYLRWSRAVDGMKDSRREYTGAIETCRREIDVWYYLYAKRSLDQGWYDELS